MPALYIVELNKHVAASPLRGVCSHSVPIVPVETKGAIETCAREVAKRRSGNI